LLTEMAKNPLLLATASGTLFNLLGGALPEVAAATLSRMGSASVALGLLMVGAGLKLEGLHEARGISAYFTGIKLLVLPALSLMLTNYFALPPLQKQIAIMFAALPTASSAYVLATRMGGHGPLVAFLITASTLLSIIMLPVWLLLAG
jgi:predicted permease